MGKEREELNENVSEFKETFGYPWKWGTNGSWIDYWRAFSGEESNINPVRDKDRDYEGLEPLTEYLSESLRYDMVGAHIQINRGDGWDDTLYIAPVYDCVNKRRGEEVVIPYGTMLVEMCEPVVIPVDE